jgi:hypothetical protein
MKTYEPSDAMRLNSLSILPGGSEVTVIFDNHQVIYKNIKYPDAYIRKITKENKEIRCILVDDQPVWPKKLITFKK